MSPAPIARALLAGLALLTAAGCGDATDGNRIVAPAPPPPPPPPSTGAIARIFLADSGGRAIRAFVQGDHPAPSPDGVRLAYERDGHVRIIDLDGTGDMAIAPGATPAWSPDGRRLAITNATGIVVVDLRGTIERVVVRHDFHNELNRASDMRVSKPAWSADGTAIAFERLGDDEEPTQVFVVSLADGAPRVFTDNGQPARWPESDPAFSPDGKLVALWSHGFGLAVARVDDGKPATLPHEFASLRQLVNPEWSYDGRYLAVTLRRDASSSIGVIDVARGTSREIIPDARDAAWSHDGRSFAFVREVPR